MPGRLRDDRPPPGWPGDQGRAQPEPPGEPGGLCPRGQSAVQGLYDPDRVRRPLVRHANEFRPSSWPEALAAIADHLRRSGGRAIVVSRLETGSLAEVMRRFAEAFGDGPPALYEPFDYAPLRQANALLFGTPVIPDYRLDRCGLILSFGVDFLGNWISPVRWARQFAAMHSPREGGRIGRLVQIGPRRSLTAVSADDFLQVPPGTEAEVALAVLREVAGQAPGGQAGRIRELIGATPAPRLPSGVTAELVQALARAFLTAEGAVALGGPVGAEGPAALRGALAAGLLNQAAGMVGRTVLLSRPHALTGCIGRPELARLLEPVDARDVVFLHEANPVYDQPAVAERLDQAGLVVALGTLLDESARHADWMLPVDSPLESWGEYEPSAGIRSLLQPTMGRVFDTRGAGDVFLELARRAERPLFGAADFATLLRERWQAPAGELAPGVDPSEFWRRSLAGGGAFIESVEETGSSLPERGPAPGGGPAGAPPRAGRCGGGLPGALALALGAAPRWPGGQPPLAAGESGAGEPALLGQLAGAAPGHRRPPGPEGRPDGGALRRGRPRDRPVAGDHRCGGKHGSPVFRPGSLGPGTAGGPGGERFRAARRQGERRFRQGAAPGERGPPHPGLLHR